MKTEQRRGSQANHDLPIVLISLPKVIERERARHMLRLVRMKKVLWSLRLFRKTTETLSSGRILIGIKEG